MVWVRVRMRSKLRWLWYSLQPTDDFRCRPTASLSSGHQSDPAAAAGRRIRILTMYVQVLVYIDSAPNLRGSWLYL